MMMMMVCRQIYASGVVRRLVDGVGSTTASLTTDVTEYSAGSGAAAVRRLATPLTTPRSSPLPPHGTTSNATGPCRWTHLQQQQQQGYGVLDDSVEDFALMASLVSASSSNSCDDILLKGP